MNTRLMDSSNTLTQPTPGTRLSAAEFFALPDDEIRTLFPGVDEFARELMADRREAEAQKQEGA